jgi:predicted amidohydrolase YtcJ
VSIAALAGLAAAATLAIGGGRIHTLDPARPQAEAIAVADGRIVYVGDEGGLAAWLGPHTRVLDLDGATLYPGFTDAHAHLFGIGLRERTLDLAGVRSLAALLEKVRAHAADSEGPLVARGWLETHWPEARMPRREDLDRILPERPVLLVRADGHAGVANSAALVQAGIGTDTPDPAGGRIERDAAGRPTGMLVDAALDPVEQRFLGAYSADRDAIYEAAAARSLRMGWTQLHNMWDAQNRVGAMERLSEAGRLPLRIYNAAGRASADAERLLAEGPRRSPSGRVVTRAIKVYMDGALGSRGAALLAPYADRPGTAGLLLADHEDTLALYRRALRAGVQICTHAIGDRGNRLVLDWYAEAFAGVPAAERAIAEPRWRIEHAQVIHADDLSRFAQLGVIPSMQPSHAIGDLHFAPARLGLERLAGAYAWRTLLESGVPLAAGSDAPVELGDPRIEFYAMVARRDLAGYTGPGWRPEEALDRASALRALTQWPAWAAFQEDELGSIEVGKRADFTAFDRDLLSVPVDEILDAVVVLTVVDGEVAYAAH